ncbi:hypothetical protein CONPUDRAFT_108689 [Coniophora puteana RWD-64-598 SS2]|uniref:GPI-anchor transamidase n=1 Tax=Coniophora puteana (strain RWD-64-598) TaxID=741705 RepID=A0A5M3MJC3_CONPW|nr:uncharacterized protein CONPUDRAFT_108689 [Coniophora puteana RWD-64-598 SS2]EIW78701.1 hypothetical protein CONPUDRAFT_108689 [Coniophora puteana RWD-64-598 SS2]
MLSSLFSRCWALLLLSLALWTTSTTAEGETPEKQAADFFGRHESTSGHTNNWAVLVCASRYWFNYRHMANALGMYRTVKRLGVPDSHIILMLADDAACNPRNPFPGSVFASSSRSLDLYGSHVEVDYRGTDVTVENFLRLLTGRVSPDMPRSKRLLSDDKSNVFVYMTGHGGNEFLKFQDSEEISAFDIADAFEQMWQKRRYNELFFMIDTCQANTMYTKFYSPNILATGSSQIEENSYSYENDADIGVSVIDSYTHFVLEYMERINKTSQTSLQDFFNAYNPHTIRSHPGVRSDLFQRPLSDTLLTDFFGGVAHAEIFDSSSSNIDFELDEEFASKWQAVYDDACNAETSSDGGDAENSSERVAQSSIRKIGEKLDLSPGKWKEARKWASVASLGALIAWAASRW